MIIISRISIAKRRIIAYTVNMRKANSGFRYWRVIAIFLCVGIFFINSAEGKQVKDFRSESVRAEFVQRSRRERTAKKAEALEWARARGAKIRGTYKGKTYELMEIRDGRPIYYITYNVDAAISTAADTVRNTAPYNANGSGITVGVWDAGAARASHQEFGGRVTIKDGSANDWHATHVTGTIGAAGVDPDALGMAPSVLIDSYDWNDDVAEMASRAAASAEQAGKIYLSNHSYGSPAGWEDTGTQANPHWEWPMGITWQGPDTVEDNFGQYNSQAVNWDQIAYNAPYYLIFKSAGNDRNDNPSVGETVHYYDGGWQSLTYSTSVAPAGDGNYKGGYDTLPTYSTAKNIMTVGAVDDAVLDGSRNLGEADMASFSSWGPCDDGRIKPDIAANGESLKSTDSDNDSDYTWASGTSMSSPNASGSAVLLIDYYGLLHPGQAMRSSTLKGLILHTADDLGNAGPDYQFGWGLMNTKAAADIITADLIREGLLNSGNTSDTYAIFNDGTHPVKVTICWTDPAASSISGHDNTSPRLINDLDVRVVGPGVVTYYPYILDGSNPSAAATTGDNVLDNVEQVYIESPIAGPYTITVSHKGTLTNGQQYYSLITSDSFDTVKPIADSNSITIQQGEAVNIRLVADDDGFPIPPGQLDYIITSLPGYGDLNDPCVGVITNGELPYTLTDGGDTVLYSPIPCYLGTDGFEFMVDDGGSDPNGGQSNTASVSIDANSMTQVLYSTGFDGGLPADWSIINGLNDEHTWLTDNPENRTSAYWNGDFMIVDSDHEGGVDLFEQLLSPVFDFSYAQDVNLTFGHRFERNNIEKCDVDIRINGGVWINLARYTGSDTQGNVFLDLSSWADGKPNVQLRWYYYDANYEWFWGIDDVVLTGRNLQLPPAGDFEPDCDVDFADYAQLAVGWLSDSNDVGWDPSLDISEPNDGIINNKDLRVLAENWLAE